MPSIRQSRSANLDRFRAESARPRRLKLEPLEARVLLSINVTTYRYDNLSSGLNANESSLNPVNVNQNSLSKQYATLVDGQVLAEPLYLSGVNVTAPGSAGKHNVVFVATEHDGLYAIDADGGNILWQDSFINGTSITTVSSNDVNSGDITPEVGITGTPAIDPANGVLYVVAKTKQIVGGDASNPHFVNTLYKVNVADGTNTSSVIADTTRNANGSYTYNSGPYVLGSGDGAINVGGQNRVYFNSLRQMFRPGVTLSNGQVYLASASHGDNGPYHGWVLAYNATTLAPTGVLNTTPNGGLGGIWEAGDSLVTDGSYFYFETGNGTFNQGAGNFNAQGFPIDGNYGDSFVKIGVDTVHNSAGNQNINGWGLKVVDYFTPFNQGQLNGGDTDLGSGGPMILPDAAGSATHPHLLVGGGKEGKIYLIDRDNMGKFNPNTDLVVQEQGGAVGGILSTPAYFNGHVYYTSSYGGATESFAIANGAFPTNASGTVVPSSQTPDGFGNLDGAPVISASGTVNGVLWALDRGTGQLRAYDAANLGTQLYTSAQAPNNRDQLGAVMKFSVPMVADGRVFVGTGNALVAYGLPAPPTSPPAAPTNLSAAAPFSGLVTLNWIDHANNESTFIIERSPDGMNNWSQVGTVGVNVMTFNDTSVQALTTYFYRVKANNALGDSAYTNVASVTTTAQPPLGAGDGLLGSYYAGTSFNTFDLKRVDPTVNFNWSSTGPDPSLGTTNFSVKWTGEVQAQYTGPYTFYTQSDDGVRLFVNGQLVIDDWSDHPPIQDVAQLINLVAGNSYAIELDYYQNGGGAVAALQWSGPQTNQQAIPQSQLFSGVAPPAPTNLQGSVVSGTQINLNWQSNASFATGFEVDRKQGAGGTYAPIKFLPPGSSSFMDTGLSPGVTYYYEVRATNFGASSAFSNEVSFITAIPPATPSGAHPTAVTTSSVAFAWQNNATDATAIRIFRAAGQGGTFIFVTALPPTANSYTDTGPAGKGLTPGTQYDYHVQAGNAAGYSDFTGFVVTTRTLAPTQPVAVGASGQVSLSWNAPAGAATFNLYRSTAPGAEGAVPWQTGLIGTTFVDHAVSNGTPYYYLVTAVTTGGESAPSAEFTATPKVPAAVSPPPGNPTAAPGDKQAALSWSAAAGASAYNLYRGTASGAETLVKSGIAGTSYLDLGLTDGVTYYYRLTSVNQIGEGIRSIEFTVVPQIVVPPAPINVTATPGDGKVALSWSPAADAQTYNVYRSIDSGNEVLYRQGLVGTSFTDTGVSNGVTYYYQVSAGNGVGESNLSLEASAKPLPALPAAPLLLAPSSSNDAQIALQWQAATAPVASFQLQRSTDGVNFAPLVTLDGSVTNFVDSNNLTPGVTYSYRISATNLAGPSMYSNVVSATPLAHLGPPWADADIGATAIPGTAWFSAGSLHVSGAGNDIWGTSDQFHFAYQPLAGDGTIIARVASQTATDPWAKAGLMIRETLDPASKYVTLATSASNGIVVQTRTAPGAASNLDNVIGGAAPYWLELVRIGATFVAFVSPDGANWSRVGTYNVPMNSQVYVGLCVTSHNPAAASAVAFDHLMLGPQVYLSDLNWTSASNGFGPVERDMSNGQALAGDGHTITIAGNTYAKGLGVHALSDVVYMLAGAYTRLLSDVGVDDEVNGNGSVDFQVLADGKLIYDSGVVRGGQSPAHVDLDLSGVQSLDLRVTDGGDGNNFDHADWAGARVLSALPAAPTGLVGQAQSGTSVALNWTDNGTNDLGYKVFRQDPASQSLAQIAALPAGAKSFVDSGLAPGATYAYQVRASNTLGDSVGSNTLNLTLPVTPLAPSTLQPAQITISSARLNWQLNSTNETGVHLYRRSGASSSFALINTLNAGTNTYVDQPLAAGTTYEYQVAAFNLAGESAFADAGLTTLPTAPTALATAGAAQVTLNWSAPVGALAYNVYRGLSAGGEGSSPYLGGYVGTHFVDTGVTTGTKYFYKITAVDFSGESAASTEVSATPLVPATVVGRWVFYNNSKYDGNTPGPGATDDAAIATDKTALLPGQTATFVNYTSYSRGINGVMLDVSGLPSLPALTDFSFRVGNDNNPAAWPLAPAPNAISVRPGAGAGGSSRVTLMWNDGAIQKEWLQITLLADADTGLALPDTFYFGNAVGDTGDSASDAFVNATDELLARHNPHSFVNPATITNNDDFNRDGFVDATDQLISRHNGTTFLNALHLIAAPAGGLTAAQPSGQGPAAFALATLPGATSAAAPAGSTPGALSGAPASALSANINRQAAALVFEAAGAAPATRLPRRSAPAGWATWERPL